MKKSLAISTLILVAVSAVLVADTDPRNRRTRQETRAQAMLVQSEDTHNYALMQQWNAVDKKVNGHGGVFPWRELDKFPLVDDVVGRNRLITTMVTFCEENQELLATQGKNMIVHTSRSVDADGKVVRFTLNTLPDVLETLALSAGDVDRAALLAAKKHIDGR